MTAIPTASVNDRYEGKIPSGLERVLWKISGKIPVSIVTSKDYAFIHHKTMFAKAAFCVLGIETLLLDHTRLSERDHNYDCIKKRTLSLDVQILKKNSYLLSLIADTIYQKFKDLRIERKFTITGDLLIGITIDWRHLDNWNSFRQEAESSITSLIAEYNSKGQSQNHDPLYLQTLFYIQWRE
jgi:hypothetical protein